MSTLKTSNITHGSNTGTANIGLASDGKVTIATKKLYCPGTVIQVASETKTGATSNDTDAGTWWSYTTHHIDITPTSTDSKVLVTGHMSLSREGAGYIFIALYKGGSAITDAIGNELGNRPRATTAGYVNNVAHVESIPFSFLDSPSTTSEVTYSLAFRHDAGSTKNIAVNRSFDNTNNVYQPRCHSTITAIEIAG